MSQYNWTRNQPQQNNVEIVQRKRDYTPIIALIMLIAGTLGLAGGALWQWGAPIGIMVFGGILMIVGLALSYTRD